MDALGGTTSKEPELQRARICASGGNLTDNHDLLRGVIIGVLLMMVIRSVDWIANPPLDASVAPYALNVVNIVVCGLTAYATWRPSAGALRVLQSVSRKPQKPS